MSIELMADRQAVAADHSLHLHVRNLRCSMTVTVPASDIPNTLFRHRSLLYRRCHCRRRRTPRRRRRISLQLTALQIQLINNLMANAFGRGYGSQANGTPSYILPATVLSSLSINA